MKKRLGTYLVTAFCMIASFAGCGREQTPQQNNEQTISIGAIIPLTGEVATYGQSLKKGFTIAEEEFAGDFKIFYEDSKAAPKDGASAFQKLQSVNHVNYYLGDATSGVCLAIAPLAEANKCLMMVSIATSDDLRTAGDYIFRNAPANRKQALAAADYVQKSPTPKAAILCKQNPYGVNLATVFRQEMKQRGIDIVFDDNYSENTKDFSDIVTRLNASGATVAFIPGNYEETAALLRRARELGSKIQFIGTDGAYSPKLMELAGPASEGFLITMMTIDEKLPFSKSFTERFKSKYGEVPDTFSCYGYEGALLLMKTIKEVGSDVEKVKAALYTKTFDSLTGPLQFDQDGEVQRNYGILIVSNGAYTNYNQ